MTPTQKAVEAALDAADYIPNPDNRKWMRAALEAALAVDGLVLVPKEPTQAMIDAALRFDWGPGINCDEHDASPWNVYQAMIAAASAANDGEERR
jgi:hypothetical protein